MSKVEDVLSAAKITDLIKREEEKKKPSKCVIVFAVIGVLVAVAAAVYGVYRFFTPDYLDDFEDDFEDEFDNDFFEDEDDAPAAEPKKEAGTASDFEAL
jgi:flagellar basal body-associated protein FliL